jgi:predicted molibdopterin-dependent oxidoreductase YjgC
MKNYFLLEVGVEELPSRFVESTLTQIKENLEKSLKENRVEFENIEKYGTPRRLTFVINNICDKQSDLEEELKGPSKKISVDADGNFTKPALGFMKSKGLDEANVYFKQVGKDEYLFGTLKQEGQATSEVLKEIVPAAIKGDIKGLYIFGEDPVVTDADTNHIIKALESLDFLVMSELFMTETAQYADVILPGVSYAEKEGTFSNTERRVQRVRKAVQLEGEMRLDTDIFIDLLNRMGYPQPHLTSAEIMDEVASLTPSFAGISHKRLDEVGSLQWPCPSKDHPGTPILHVGKFARGLGYFYPAEYVPSAELPDDEYPYILMTGRILYHYTTRAMTGRTPELMEIAGKSFIEMNIKDADALGIKDGDKVKVASRRGEIQTTAVVGTKVSPGETWMPFHFPDGNANWLTNAALDKFAKAPEYKVCAIKIAKA